MHEANDETEADLDRDLEDEGDDEGSETQGEAGSADHAEAEQGGARRRSRRRGKKGDEEYLPEGDARALQALEFVNKVIQGMEMDCRTRLHRPKEDDSPDEINVEIYGRDAGRIIGKKGQVLQAIQFLVHRVINRPGLDRRHVFVDAEGYRSRRDTSLATMARRLGKQAVDEGKIITFEPMSPRDRRVVHLALAKFDGVITKSDGEGDERRVQIIPVRRGAAAPA
jgi:spoIIIJ-associated protein